MPERRKRQRFWFQQPITLRFLDWRQIHGLVENASEIGVLLISGSEVSRGTQVEATIDLLHSIRVFAPGSVERAERCLDGKIALAVKCHRPFTESANPSFVPRRSWLNCEPMTAEEQVGTEAGWPLEPGQIIVFNSLTGLKTGVLKEVRWGLVWRGLILEDGRVIAEHRVLDSDPPVWRKPDEVPQDEQRMWEAHLLSMAEAGLDPRDREQAFWAELNQYLAYTYLRFKGSRRRS